VESMLHWLGYGLCHQLPERSFIGGGIQVPVCARDTGIYMGFVVAILVMALLEGRERPTEPPSLLKSLVLGLMVGTMVFDGVTSYAGLRATTNEIRLLTGLAAGYALAAFTLPLLNGQLWAVAGRGRVLGTNTRFGLFLGSLPIAWLLIFYIAPVLGIFYPLMVGVAVILTFMVVNLVIVCLLPAFERKANRLTDAWPALLISLGLTAAELILASYLKYWLESVAGLR